MILIHSVPAIPVYAAGSNPRVRSGVWLSTMLCPPSDFHTAVYIHFTPYYIHSFISIQP